MIASTGVRCIRRAGVLARRVQEGTSVRGGPVSHAYSRILAPIDATPLGEEVLEVAFRFAARHGGSVEVLQIRDAVRVDPSRPEADLAEIEDQIARLAADMRGRAKRYELSPDHVDAHVRTGPLADTIVLASQELGADLIVMGTHGRHGLADLFAGSTTERVVRRATADVLVVKPLGFPD